MLGTAAASQFLFLEALVYLPVASGTPNPNSRFRCSGCGWKRWSEELQIKPQSPPWGDANVKGDFNLLSSLFSTITASPKF